MGVFDLFASIAYYQPFFVAQTCAPKFHHLLAKKVREKSRECHNHKPQPFPDPKRKRKPTNLNKHKPNKRTKSTKISSLFPKRGNRNTKRTEKHKNKMTHGKTYNKSPRRINHKARKSNTGTTALERSVEQTTVGLEITRLLQPLYVFKSFWAYLRRCVFCSSVSKRGTHLAQTFLRSKRFFQNCLHTAI